MAWGCAALSPSGGRAGNVNTAAIRAYEKAGFRTIGERRQSGYWLGQPANETLIDAILADFPCPSAVRQIVDPAGG
jgi:hypothetical protein